MTTTTRPATSSTAESTISAAGGAHQSAGMPAPTVEELERAWQALREGRFRRTPVAAAAPRPSVESLDGPMVVVAGVHGWAGTSTTALLIGDAAVRRGDHARVVDTAPPARSGFVAAAEAEFGVDETGRWRIGGRGRLGLQRPADPFTGSADTPAPLPAAPGTAIVIDCAWTVHDLLAARDGRLDNDDVEATEPMPDPWVTAALLSAPLVLAVRATIPGLRHLEHSLDAIAAYRDPALPVVVALLGLRPVHGTTTRPLPRSLAVSAGPRTTACAEDRRLVAVPERPAMAEAGLTPAPIPRELHPAADLLLTLTHPRPAADAGDENDSGPGDLSRTRRAIQHFTRTPQSTTTTPSSTTNRKDTTS